MQYLKDVQTKLCIFPIYEAFNNFAFICKKIYFYVVKWNWIVWYTKWYLYTCKYILPVKFDLEVQNDFKIQPIMCWLSKIHKTPTEETPPRKCSTKASSKAVTKAFRLILKQIQSFHENSDYKTFWMAQNLETVTDRLDQIKTKHNANLIYTFDFIIFYNKLPHKDLITFWLDLSFNRGFSLY